MVVCRYFLEGQCTFGVKCKFEHVDPYRGYDSSRGTEYSPERPQGTSILKASSSPFGGQEYSHTPQHNFVQPQQHGFGQNSFGQTPQNSFHQTPQHGFSSPLQQGSFSSKPQGLRCNVQEIMQVVMRDIAQLEKGGQWQLSSYSPLKDLPNIPGLDDYSPEELRWECYKALQNGSLPLCQVIVQQLFANVAKINNELKRKDSGYSIIDRWLRDSESQSTQNTTEQTAPAVSSTFSSSASIGAFSSPSFTSESQSQPQTPNSFSFSLPSQQPSPTNPFLPQQQPSPNMFQQNSSVFSNNQASFTSNHQSSAFSPSNQTSAFTSQNSQSAFSSPLRAQAVDSQVYSTVEELSESELKAFQASRFVLGAIPTKPPPRSLCNM